MNEKKNRGKILGWIKEWASLGSLIVLVVLLAALLIPQPGPVEEGGREAEMATWETWDRLDREKREAEWVQREAELLRYYNLLPDDIKSSWLATIDWFKEEGIIKGEAEPVTVLPSELLRPEAPEEPWLRGYNHRIPLTKDWGDEGWTQVSSILKKADDLKYDLGIGEHMYQPVRLPLGTDTWEVRGTKEDGVTLIPVDITPRGDSTVWVDIGPRPKFAKRLTFYIYYNLPGDEGCRIEDEDADETWSKIRREEREAESLRKKAEREAKVYWWEEEREAELLQDPPDISTLPATEVGVIE